MVERLKIAIDKARAQRAKAGSAAPARQTFLGAPLTQAPPETDTHAPSPPPAAPFAPQATGEPHVPTGAPSASDLGWDNIREMELDARHLARNRVITHARTEDAHVAFDVLRTRILRVFRKQGWRRLGITSPTKGCGKTFVATNLALSLSRQQECRTILMDMDLRAPSIARVLGLPHPEEIASFLNGEIEPADYLVRCAPNLAVGLNAERIRDAAETIQSPATAQALGTMMGTLSPDIVIYDLPPMLSCDDVIGFLPHVDCILLIVGGGKTRPPEVAECERQLATRHNSSA